jgi:thiol-disulfide isomerase/thioredoxin
MRFIVVLFLFADMAVGTTFFEWLFGIKPDQGPPAYTVLSSDSDLQVAINGSDEKPVIAWFTASWCGPCKMIAPSVGKMATAESSIEFIQIDIDEHPALADAIGIQAVPTFVMYLNKAEVGRTSGAVIEKIQEMVDANRIVQRVPPQKVKLNRKNKTNRKVKKILKEEGEVL